MVKKRIKKSSFNRRVRRRMNQLGLTQVEVAGALGWSQGCLGHLITGRTKMVMADRIFPLADVLQCDPRWLALGDETETEEDEVFHESVTTARKRSGLRFVTFDEVECFDK